ncbi:MAG: MvaI/BcnI family restriction endonuclease [Christensenellaceae bacterium]
MWTKELVIERLQLIERKGFISVPEEMFRTDDGIVGQILEREFDVLENNLHLADLGTFELKGMRYKKNKPNMLTLFHQTSTSGLTPNEIFERFGYIRKSNRSDTMKKKLFTTIRGDKKNSLGFILKANSESEICLYHEDEYLSTWDLSSGNRKINHTILAFADTIGTTNSKDEQFHYIKAYLLDGAKKLSDAINSGAVVMDLCIDQPADKSKGIHDRGPHIRIPVKKLDSMFETVEQIL